MEQQTRKFPCAVLCSYIIYEQNLLDILACQGGSLLHALQAFR